MEVYLNEMNGLANAFIALRESKRHMDREQEMEIRENVLSRTSANHIEYSPCIADHVYCNKPHDCVSYYMDGTSTCRGGITCSDSWLAKMMKPLLKHGTKHITLLKFIDMNFTVYGLHRAGQDDLDSHAERMNNRIIRASTRLGRFEDGEMSDWYKGKILTTDQALAFLGITTPNEIIVEGKTYVKAPNGYILKGKENSNDVRRGLYMLSIPSDFIFSINMAEFAHVYKQRREGGGAHPELKQAVEMMADQLEVATAGWITRDVLMEVEI